MADDLATRYPLVLVPGMLGFVRLGPYPYWFGIPAALRRGGAAVHTVQVSPLNGNELRGEQLLGILQGLQRSTGAERFNLIGHSQGAITARYAAAKHPEWVASVTSVAGPNRGSELADYVEQRWPPGSFVARLAGLHLLGAGKLIEYLETDWKGPRQPLDVHASHEALTSAGMADFNARYPQGLAAEWGGQGESEVDGVRYYSWSGTLQPGRTDRGANRFDNSQRFCRLFARAFSREKGECDGMVGRVSSHLGEVIGDDFPLDHLDIVNQSLGLVGYGADPVRLFVEHARRLKAAGL